MNERASMTLKIDADDQLLCPNCGFHCIHIDDVFIAGRPREDSDVVPVHVDNRGHVHADEAVRLPIPDGQVGRRHVFSLVGWCEGCPARFAIEFKQHKGSTYVAIRSQTWT